MITGTLTRLALGAMLAAGLADTSLGQVASSANFNLDGLSVDSAVGGSSSENFTHYTQVGTLATGSSASANFSVEVGFLSHFDPDPGTRPVLWAVIPHHADKAGGEPLEAYGRNLGVVPTFTIGGQNVVGTGVSQTKATLTSPSRAAGQANVIVDNGSNTATLVDGFVYSPAIVAPATAYQDSLWPISSYGDPSHTFALWASPTPIPGGLNTQFGLLLIGPTLLNLVPSFPYLPTTGGVSTVELRVPIEPALVGFSFYLQNVNVDPLNPPGQLTNSVSTTFQ